MNNYFNISTFREFLPEFKHKMTPDSGPIILGNGVAATGLGLNAASSMQDWKSYNKILRLMKVFGYTFNGIDRIVGPNIVTGIGSDLLSTSMSSSLVSDVFILLLNIRSRPGSTKHSNLVLRRVRKGTLRRLARQAKSI